MLFHITAKRDSDAAKNDGVYRPESLVSEGFIHCSYAHQVCGVADRLFQNCRDLVLLQIDSSQLLCDAVNEDLYGSGERFPHIYGELPWSAVVAVHEFPCVDTNGFCLPAAVKSR